MSKLFFGSFADIIHESACDTMNIKDIVGWLMCIAMRPEDLGDYGFRNEGRLSRNVEESFPAKLFGTGYFIPAKDKVTRYREISERSEQIPEKYRKTIYDPTRYELVLNRFADFLAVCQNDIILNDIVFRMKKLIQYDFSIDPHTREVLLRLIKEHDSSQPDIDIIAKFLTETYIFAVGRSAKIRPLSKAFITNIDPTNNYFTGRDQYLFDIEEKLSHDPHIAILCGMSGIGKTQIALQYANNAIPSCDIIWWIHNYVGNDRITDYASFLRGTGIQPAFSDPDSIRLDFLKYFNTVDLSWLLIYDNCNFESESDYFDFKKQLPVSKKGRIIITTQTKLSFCGNEPIEIAGFDNATAREFLKRRTGKAPNEATDAIITSYGGHPLALEYAGAYISQDGMTYKEYLSQLENEGALSLLNSKAFGAAPDYSMTLKFAFMLTYKRLCQELSNIGKLYLPETLMFIWALYLPEELPRKIEVYPPEAVQAPFSELFSNRRTFDETIYFLSKYSIIRTIDSKIIMHPLTKEIAKSLLDEEETKKLRNRLSDRNNVIITYSNEKMWITLCPLEKSIAFYTVYMKTQNPDYVIDSLAVVRYDENTIIGIAIASKASDKTGEDDVKNSNLFQKWGRASVQRLG